ncbi:MAG: acyl-CoA reductase [Flavobacteriales bacterium]|nr:acyl-CoA reductase [Flavobacteriales bacterium]
MATEANVLSLDVRITALAQLGVVMKAIGAGAPWPGHSSGLVEAEYMVLDDLARRAHNQNGWATEENVRHAFAAWGEALQRVHLTEWSGRYPELNTMRTRPRMVGLILAGNIPLVGLHDVLCVWLSGHRARVKCSSQETELVPGILSVLDRFAPGTAQQIEFITGKLGEVEAVVATGSNNTSRYFEHYFGHLPRIVRKNRVSVAVLDGSETEEELTALGEDVFRYFGLGCRNVSKLLIPCSFDTDRLFKAFFPWKDIVHHNKYGNNYDYTRALWMLDRINFVENGFLLLKSDDALASPVATLFYERYDFISTADAYIAQHRDSIQCIVGRDGRTPFGRSQYPELWEYADGVDTMRFLLDLK